jgi:hypothetical protein
MEMMLKTLVAAVSCFRGKYRRRGTQAGPPRGSASHPAAIHDKYFTRNVVARRRSQEHGSARDIFRFTPACGRNARQDLAASQLVVP